MGFTPSILEEKTFIGHPESEELEKREEETPNVATFLVSLGRAGKS